MGYIIVAPGMKVGEVGEADVIPRDQPKLAVAYALAAQYLGMQYVYLEAGSGAPQPVPEDIDPGGPRSHHHSLAGRRGHPGRETRDPCQEGRGQHRGHRHGGGERQLHRTAWRALFKALKA